MNQHSTYRLSWSCFLTVLRANMRVSVSIAKEMHCNYWLGKYTEISNCTQDKYEGLVFLILGKYIVTAGQPNTLKSQTAAQLFFIKKKKLIMQLCICLCLCIFIVICVYSTIICFVVNYTLVYPVFLKETCKTLNIFRFHFHFNEI